MYNRKNILVSIGLVISILVNVFFIIFIALFSTGSFPSKESAESTTIKEVVTGSTIPGLPAEFKVVDEVWRIINEDFINKGTLDAKKISQGAARGMIEALGDKYSAYLDPQITKLETSEYRGSFQGIGAYVGTNKNNEIVVIAPMEDSPAKEAGLKPGDRILKIDDTETIGLSVIEAALKIQGQAGTPVILVIYREGTSEPFEVKLIRRAITIQSVYYELNNGIAYIKLTGFLQNTGSELRKYLQKVKDSKAEGIILDLRNNPGGLLDTSIDVASEFLETGIVVKAVDSDGKSTTFPVISGGLATKIPLIVLVNKGSASASEIVAGAIQDNSRAKLLGETTFGKGSVQIVRNLDDGSTIHVTTAQWITPSGRHIDKDGLQPDIVSQLEDQELVKYATELLKGKASTNPSTK